MINICPMCGKDLLSVTFTSNRDNILKNKYKMYIHKEIKKNGFGPFKKGLKKRSRTYCIDTSTIQSPGWHRV